MTRHHVEVLEPTTLLSEADPPREAFEKAWQSLSGAREGWHRASLLDADGEGGPEAPLFVKGLEVGLVWNPQQFLRRWHIRNEFRNLRALRGLAVEKPEALAWGCETRFGLPVRSFLLQRAIEGGVDFADFIAGETDPARRLDVFRAVGRAVRALHESGWIHGDLACRNLMVRPAGPEVVFVDLARAKPTRRDRLGWGRRKELYRLVKSADKCGAAPGEVDAMMGEAAGDAAPEVVTATRHLRSIGRRGPRKLWTWYWRVTGRPLGS